MNDERRLLPRVAAKIYQSLARREAAIPTPQVPNYLWLGCCDQAKKIVLAKSRGWVYSLERLKKNWLQKVEHFRNSVEESVRYFSEVILPQEINSLREIYNDLVALDDEFDQVEYDLRDKTIAVTTEPVTLEGVYLGPFQICLKWDALDSDLAYTIVALEPNCAAANDETVHPHVENDQLCEGDGREKIAASLKNGCLFEFFILVRQILETYNDASAYVSLSSWYGYSCPACGDSVNDDDLTSCQECSEYLCLDCARSCRCCHQTSCGNCAMYCADCDTPSCPDCRFFCEGCDDLFCKECLNEEFCRECQKTREKEKEEKSPSEPEKKKCDADAALQSIRLGEACLLPEPGIDRSGSLRNQPAEERCGSHC